MVFAIGKFHGFHYFNLVFDLPSWVPKLWRSAAPGWSRASLVGLPRENGAQVHSSRASQGEGGIMSDVVNGL